MTVRYVSSFSVRSLHGMINRCLLGMLCELYPGKVECYATKSSLEMLRDSVPSGAVSRWHALPVNSRPGKIWLLLRYISSAFYNILILLFSRRDDILFYNFNNVMSTRLLNAVNRFMHRNIVICCHGEMEYIANASKHSQLYKRLMSALTNGFFNSRRKSVSDGMRFIVFGDVIRDNLSRYLSDVLMERIHVVDHPVEMLPQTVTANSGHGGIRIGTAGILNSYKGSDSYPVLALALNDCDNIYFSVVGHLQCDSEPLRRAGIDLSGCADDHISDDEFLKRVSGLDYLLFLYPADTYRLIASGAILDSIRFRRPIIGISTDYFRYIFDKFGQLGFLADDVDSLADTIRKFKEKDIPAFDFDGVARRLSPEALLPALKDVMENCYVPLSNSADK